MVPGVLKPKEFEDMYSRFFPGNDANMFVKNVFRNFDVDKNGQIGRLEEISALKIYTDMITSNPAISASFINFFPTPLDTMCQSGKPRDRQNLKLSKFCFPTGICILC